MLIDKLLLLSDAQAFTATAVSANTVDLLAANNAIGDGEPIGIAFTVDVAADFTTGDETYTFAAISDDAANLASPTVLAQRAILAADLTAGSQHMIPLPAGTPLERYIGLKLTVAGTTPTITLTAWVTPVKMFAKVARSYPKGYSS